MQHRPLAIITGASRGIGKSTAARFAHAGYDVLALARTPVALPGVQSLAVDLASPKPGFAEQLRAAIGAKRKIILVHNAAKSVNDRVDSVDLDELRSVLAVNVVAVAELNTAIIPLMGPDSWIVYIGSTLSEKAVANGFSYVLSKHASVGMMRATAQDLLGKSIYTACICPGFTATEMLKDRLKGRPEVESTLMAMVSGNRFITPEEMAECIFMTTQNPVLNGSILHANLGQKET